MNIEHQIAIVQHYINCRKNKKVNIRIDSFKDLALLNKAYIIASNWFKENNLEIHIIN